MGHKPSESTKTWSHLSPLTDIKYFRTPEMPEKGEGDTGKDDRRASAAVDRDSSIPTGVIMKIRSAHI